MVLIMVVTIIVVLVLMAGSFFLYRGRHKQRWLPRLAGSGSAATGSMEFRPR